MLALFLRLALGFFREVGSIVLQPFTAAGTVTVRQPGGVALVDEVRVYHDGSNGYIQSMDGSFRVDVTSVGFQLWETTGGGNYQYEFNRSSGEHNFRGAVNVLVASFSGTGFDAVGNLTTPIQFRFRRGGSFDAGLQASAAGQIIATDGNVSAPVTYMSIGINGTTTYRSVATAGWGQPAIYGSGRVVGTVDSRAAAAATYTVGAADGSFMVSGNVLVTTSTAHSFSLDVSYTDESNVARVLILPMAALAGAFIAGGLITAAGPFESAAVQIRCKASTAITIRVSSGGTYTGVTYNSEGSIRQVA